MNTKKDLISKLAGEEVAGIQHKLPITDKRPLTDQEILDSLNLRLKYDSKWAIELIRFSREGNSLEAFCAKFNISPSQIEKWKDIFEFNEAVRMAKASEIFYWEKRLSNCFIETEEGFQIIDQDSFKICKFRLENLGYKSKLGESNKVLFKEEAGNKKKKVGVSLQAEKDLVDQTEEKIASLLEVLARDE